MDDMPEKMRRFMSRKPRKGLPKKKKREPLPRRWVTHCLRTQKDKCFYCGARLKKGPSNQWAKRATLDHVVPLSGGGPNARKNMVAACSACNSAKSSMSAEEFRRLLGRARDSDTHR